MKIYTLNQIKSVIDIKQCMKAIESGFVDYSQGRTVIPPVGSMNFENPPGDVHIKYGHVMDQTNFFIKIASGFYENSKLGLPTGNGMILEFSKQTGAPVSLLWDEGYLTDLRTAIAGAIAAKYLAPKNIRHIGIVGTGTQARMQLELLQEVVPCRSALVWGRNPKHIDSFFQEPSLSNFTLKTARDISEICARCQLIITATPAKAPLILDVGRGTHITAVGADEKGKQEISENVFAKADRIIVDSREQCFAFGDTSHALAKKMMDPKFIHELGEIIADKSLGRMAEEEITIADLTGVAVQDIQIANSVLQGLKNAGS
ncbi:MAG: ornithine cyclodeaminase family protein [Simkaniaceae bacterium]